MKILVINSSPRGERSNTQILVNAFLEGAAEAGATGETIFLKGKRIEPCCGNFHCWLKTPGVCIHKDDMPEMLEKYREADMIVIATPLYVYTYSALMKLFLDRIIPLVQPNIVAVNGLCMHPARYEKMPRSFVLISNAGFIDPEHFSGLKETFVRTFRGDRSIAGMICCAGGEMLRNPGLQDAITWYIDAVRQAGREAVSQGMISNETQSIIDKPLMDDQQVFLDMANTYFNSVLAQLDPAVDMVEASHGGTPLPPPSSMDNMQDLISGMAMVFNADEGRDLTAAIQFEVTDESPGRYFLQIADGKCTAFAGECSKPTATIKTPSDVWMAIARKELNGATAFMTGKYKVSGDLGLLMRLENLFPGG